MANLDLASGRYAEGVGSILELVDAQGTDATARVNVVRARLQLDLARVRLAGTMGDFSPLGFSSDHGE